MVSFILSLLAGVGVPAIITGILGKFLPGLFAGTIGKFIAPIVTLCMGLVDVLLIVLRWIVAKIIAGLDHIVKSVPATFTVLVLMYGSYMYGVGLDGFWNKKPASVESRVEVPLPPRRPRPSPTETPGDWVRDILGTWTG